MPQVSVIVPAYRVTAYIKETIDSVLAQTYRDFEIIVVNDGCPDTEALEKVLEPYFSRIVYLKLEKNGGLASARNAAITASKSRYIALLDGDDLFEPNYLEVQVGLLEADQSVDVLYCDAKMFGDPKVEGRTNMQVNPSEGEVTFTSLVNLKCNVGVFVTGRREIFLKAGLFEAGRRRVEDFDMWLRIVKAGGRIAYHHGVLVRSRRRGDSLSANEEAMLVADIEVLEKARKTLALTPGELEATERQVARWGAQLDVVRGKRAIETGQTGDAAMHLGRAYAYFRTPKLRVLSVMAKVTPRLLTWAHMRRLGR